MTQIKSASASAIKSASTSYFEACVAFVRQVPVTVTTVALACEQAFGRAENWGKGKPPFPSPFLAIFSPQPESLFTSLHSRRLEVVGTRRTRARGRHARRLKVVGYLFAVYCCAYRLICMKTISTYTTGARAEMTGQLGSCTLKK